MSHAPIPTDFDELARRRAFADRMLREFGEEHRLCERCLCCDMETVECEACAGEGYTEPGLLHEIDPLWYDEDDVEPCHMCLGKPRWRVCGGSCWEAAIVAPGGRPHGEGIHADAAENLSNRRGVDAHA